jgi:hypothetical protein
VIEMKIFILGLPQSGRTTIAKAICESPEYRYIDAFSWIKVTFREPQEGEHPQKYEEEFNYWLTNRIKMAPNLVVDNIYDSMDAYNDEHINFVIDGISSPRDFTRLFDINQDVVVFLNRSGNPAEFRDYQNIGVSVMRDYCFWLSSAELLPKTRWLEYNFTIPGEESDLVKSLGHKNSVFIVRSPRKVISHLKEQLLNVVGKQGGQ